MIFAYYIVMFLSESLTKGHYLNMYLSRWVPNIVLGVVRRGRADLARAVRRGPAAVPDPGESSAGSLERIGVRSRRAAAAPPGRARRGPRPPGAGRAPVLVDPAAPHLRLPTPGLLDRYISRIYIRIVGLSFLALLGLFHISTFLDKSDKIFKGQATTADVGRLLVYMTPQFVYYVIPIAALLSVLVTFGLLSRNSELTVMKACGISLYRAVALGDPAVAGLQRRHFRPRAAGPGAGQPEGRGDRREDPAAAAAGLRRLNRQWVIGRDGAFYHYSYYNPERQELAGAARSTSRRPRGGASRTQTIADGRCFAGSGWDSRSGSADFSAGKPRWTAAAERPLPLEPPELLRDGAAGRGNDDRRVSSGATSTSCRPAA